MTKSYADASGKIFELQQEIYWKQLLESKILIVDIDTREPKGKNEILNSEKMNWEALETSGGQLVSGAVLGHYLYGTLSWLSSCVLPSILIISIAKIHGYSYKFVQAERMEGYHDSWVSPHVLRSLLPNYQFIVTMDADVTITHPEVGVEWLFNHWGVTNNTSIAMPWDQREIQNEVVQSVDSKGLQVLNTGVVVVQNLPYTKKILDAWIECPDETRYEGCGRWKDVWSHEQRAFSEYIRYDFNPDGDNIVVSYTVSNQCVQRAEQVRDKPIPCDDAMGWPHMVDEYPGRILSDCNGNFFRHHTLSKPKAKESMSTASMQLLTELLHRSFLDNKDELWYKENATSDR